MATLFLMAGLPGAGKTTRAKEPAAEHGARHERGPRLRVLEPRWAFGAAVACNSAGASAQVIYLALDRATQIDRIQHRWTHAPDETFKVTEADLDTWQALFEVPDAAELDGAELAGPPAEWPSWPDWAAACWPSLADD